MKISRIILDNFRCFEHINVDINDKLTVIVGNNGAGKTSILEGITVSLGTFFAKMDIPSSLSIKKKDVRLNAYKIGGIDDVQPQYPVEIESEGVMDGIKVRWRRSLNSEKGKTTLVEAKDITDISVEYQKRLMNGDESLTLPMLAYYGTGRLWDYHKEKRSDTFKVSTRANGYIDCLDGTANIKLMLNWFQKRTIQLAQKSENGFKAALQLSVIYHAMSLCYAKMTGFNDVKFDFNLDTYEIDCHYTDGNGLRMRIPLSQLSDGYKSTISLVADIAYRMAVLNPQLGTDIITKTDGIVLIDEVDLHLHPELQQHILRDLQEIFPKIQFIVTTHAPVVINSVHCENLVILEDMMIREPDGEIYGRDANTIIQGVMGANERPKIVKDSFSRFYNLLESGDYDEAGSCLDQIEKDIGSDDSDLVACRMKLKYRQMRKVYAQNN